MDETISEEHGMPNDPTALYDAEQVNPYSEAIANSVSEEQADPYAEEPENEYNEEPGNAYNEELENPYNEEQGHLYAQEAGVGGHQYDEEQEHHYNEEQEHGYGEEQEPQYNEEQAQQYDMEQGVQYGEESVKPYNGEVEQQQDVLQAKSEQKRWPGWPGESVFRVLVPPQKVGAIIGRKGEYIKRMCEESKARIKILDGPPGIPERVVMVSAKEESDAQVSPAMDGLMRIHRRITDGLDPESAQAPPTGNVPPTRLLVPASQAGSLIGKQGTTIKSIQEGSGTIVRIIENLPPVALHDDRVVEIQGDALGMHKAVELIAAHLRKFLVDRSVLPLYESRMLAHNVHREPAMPPPQQWGPPPRHWGPPSMPPPGPAYGGNPPYMPPQPPSNYYSPEVPPMEKPAHYGISAYGRDGPSGGGASGNQPPPHGSAQVTTSMQVPLLYADAVIGASGASISYIRRASGATVTIQESRGAPGEMTVEIIGSATQVQAAQQLIQNFMAEAGAPQASQAPQGGPVDPGYNYQSYGPSYGSVPPTGGPGPHNGGSYGQYPPSANYGY